MHIRWEGSDVAVYFWTVILPDNHIVIADYEKLFLYDVETNRSKAEYRYDDSDYYFGGFYLNSEYGM